MRSCPYRNIDCKVKQAVCPAMVTQVAIEKSATECKLIKKVKMHSHLMMGKKNILVTILNVQTLQKGRKNTWIFSFCYCYKPRHNLHTMAQIRTLIRCTERTAFWKLETNYSAYKNSVNAANGRNGILLSPEVYDTFSSTLMITLKIMVATFNGNPHTTLILRYKPKERSSWRTILKISTFKSIQSQSK